MKKIAIVTEMRGFGGLETFVLSLLDHLNTQKYEIHLFLMQEKGWGISKEVMEKYTDIQFHFEGRGSNSISSSLNIERKLAEEFVQFGPFAAVHANMDLFNGIVMSAAKKARISIRIAHIHTPGNQNKNKGLVYALKRTGYVLWMKYLTKTKATVFLGCSQSALEYAYGRSKKGQVIYNGIDISKYRDQEYSEAFLQELCDNNAKKYRLMHAGRFCEVKNPYFIVDILHELKKLTTDFTFLYAGPRSYPDEYLAYVKEKDVADNVVLLNERKDLPRIMKQCSVFLLPSLFEGVPFVLLEAQATGLSCIASDRVPELSNVGKCEYMDIQQSDAAERWAKRIYELFQNGSETSVDERLNQFDILTTIKSIEKIYDAE